MVACDVHWLALTEYPVEVEREEHASSGIKYAVIVIVVVQQVRHLLHGVLLDFLNFLLNLSQLGIFDAIVDLFCLRKDHWPLRRIGSRVSRVADGVTLAIDLGVDAIRIPCLIQQRDPRGVYHVCSHDVTVMVVLAQSIGVALVLVFHTFFAGNTLVGLVSVGCQVVRRHLVAHAEVWHHVGEHSLHVEEVLQLSVVLRVEIPCATFWED